MKEEELSILAGQVECGIEALIYSYTMWKITLRRMALNLMHSFLKEKSLTSEFYEWVAENRPPEKVSELMSHLVGVMIAGLTVDE